MENNLLFVYGTLKESSVQLKIIGRIERGELYFLNNYDLSKIKIESEFYPCIIKRENAFVEGLVISISSKELKLIDDYEGKDYKREKVILRSGKESYIYIS